MPKRRNYEENTEQELVIRWFGMQYTEVEDLLVHIPNGSNVGAREGLRLRKMGLCKGFPDLFLFVPTPEYPGLAIEMKRKKGGTLSADQKIMLERLKKMGYQTAVCHGFDEAKQVIQDYFA